MPARFRAGQKDYIDELNNLSDDFQEAVGAAGSLAQTRQDAIDAATSAQDSATAAGTSETNAGASALAAANSATSAQDSATAAGTSETNAAISEDNVNLGVQKAMEWAISQVEVEPGLYSAKYWAEQATTVVTGGLIDDAAVSPAKVWSSQKTTSELSEKANASDLLTPVPLGAVFTDTVYDDTGLQTAVTNLQTNKADKTELFSGVYGELTGIPTEFTPAAHTHSVSDVTGLQEVLDGKVDNARVLTDVPLGAVFTDTTYTIGDAGLTEKNFNLTLHNKLVGIQSGATQNASDAELRDRSTHTGVQDISTVSGLGTAATKDVSASGNAADTEVVMGNDSRLSDARTPTAHDHNDLYYTKAEVDSLASSVDEGSLKSHAVAMAIVFGG